MKKKNIEFIEDKPVSSAIVVVVVVVVSSSAIVVVVVVVVSSAIDVVVVVVSHAIVVGPSGAVQSEDIYFTFSLIWILLCLTGSYENGLRVKQFLVFKYFESACEISMLNIVDFAICCFLKLA